ncbi:MAG TPA: hypothetical protein VGG34_00250 [Opitutaceae bacterium]|jgi:hypothetical protein
MRTALRPFLVAAAALLAGCTFNVGYNPAYLPNDAMRMGIGGKGLVVISDVDAGWVYTGSPTSFSGGGTTLKLPLGEITKEIALKVFGAAFKDGVDFRSTAAAATGYRLIIEPKVNNFTYQYNQLKNLGFAITPVVDVDLHVVLLRPNGSTLLDKVYTDGPKDGASYMATGQPAEKINEVLHHQLFKLMTDAAVDAKAALGG